MPAINPERMIIYNELSIKPNAPMLYNIIDMINTDLRLHLSINIPIKGKDNKAATPGSINKDFIRRLA